MQRAVGSLSYGMQLGALPSNRGLATYFHNNYSLHFADLSKAIIRRWTNVRKEQPVQYDQVPKYSASGRSIS